MTDILKLRDLSVTVPSRFGDRTLLSSITLSIARYRTLGIVGESGSGKTLLSHCLIGLLSSRLKARGEIWFEGQNLLSSPNPDPWSDLRARVMGLIIQNPMSAFDPRQRLRKQFFQTLRLHTSLTPSACEAWIESCLHQCHLGPEAMNLLNHYPHQLSGGQLQRIMIAMALALKPQILIADEPTTALDSVSQFDVLKLLKTLAQEQSLTLIVISHDLNLLRDVADDIAVLEQGRLVETGEFQSVWRAPKQHYTQHLLQACQKLDARFRAIMGELNASESA